MAAVFEKTFFQNLQGNLIIRYCPEIVFSKDNLSNEITVKLYNGESEYSGGGTVSATVIRADGRTVPLTGTLTGNVVSLALIESCMEVPGQIQIFIRLTSGNVKTTVFAGVFTAVRTETDTVIDPGTIIPSVTDLINQIDAAIDSIPADYSTLLGSVASTYSASKTYAVGDYVWYDGALYRCTTAISTAESWTAAHWSRAVLGDDVTGLKSALNATDALLIGDGEANVDIWEAGSISGIGGNTANNARIRIKTDKRIGLTEGQLAVTCADGYEMFFPAYNQSGTYIGRIQEDGKIGDAAGAWLQSVNLIYYPETLFRIVLRNKTDPTANISVSEASNVFFHGEKYAEKTEGVETSPYVFDAINVNIESGIYDRWNNFYQTGQHVSIPVSEGEKYLIVAGSFPSTDYPLYLLKKDNSIVGYKNVSSSQMVQEELTVNDADTLIINSNKAYISVCKGYAVTAKPFSKWAGKKIAWFGTSIPETSTYNAVLGYPEYVGKLLGATVYNEAVGSSTARRGFKTAETENDPYGWTGMGIAALWNMGSTIAEKNEIITNWESKWRNLTGYNAAMTEGISSKALACSYENKLVQKYITENPVDLYVFDHGYNDWKVGDLDMNPDDPYDRSTFQGAMNTFIKLIMESNPHARILIVSHYEDQERPGLIEMQKGEAEYWNLPFARLYDRLGWANNRTVTTTGYWSNGTGNGYWIKSGGTEQTLTLKQYHMPDGRHPNIDISGRACMDIAHVLAEMIDSITPAN